jgi:hypothetical protein
MINRRLLWCMTFVLGIGLPLRAGQIASQADLQTVLGGPGTLETFEGFSLASGTAVGLDCATLNSAATCNGQGPGLVAPGFSITFSDAGGQWDGAGYFGAPSQEILDAGQPLTISFTSPVSAFGIDLRAFSGFPATATVTILGLDDVTVVGTISGVSLDSGGDPVFVGWENDPGIGEVQFSQTGESWSPIVTNLEFGTAGGAVPEPMTFALSGFGLAIVAALRRKRFSRR